jgi:DNA-binding transcriptional MocR family regulator
MLGRSRQAGEHSPRQPKLAASLGVDLTTVTRAHDEARRRHLIEAVEREALA